MTRLVPIGFLTFREAVAKLEEAIFAGIPEPKEVVAARERQYPAGDGAARRKATDELWNAVDGGTVRPVVIGGLPRRVVKLDPALTLGVPALRRTGDFSYLRQRDPAFDEVTSWFASRTTANITLAFRERDVGKVCSKLRQASRRTARPSDKQANRGRPPLQPLVRPVVIELIGRKSWNSAQSLKALARLIHKKVGRPVSEDTLDRILANLLAETGDRQYWRRRKSSGHRVKRPRYPTGSN